AESGTERFAVDVRHDIVELAAGFARVMERKDEWVPEPGQEADLPRESLHTDGGRELLAQDLDGHRAIVPAILRQVDGRHSAPAQFAYNGIALGERQHGVA